MPWTTGPGSDCKVLGENETPWDISPQDEGSCQQGQQTPQQMPLNPGALVFQREEKLEPLLEDPPEAAAPPAGTARILWPHLLLCVPSPLKFVAKPGQFYYGGGWWVCMLTFCSRRPCLSNQEVDGFLCSKSHFFGGPFLAISLLGCRHSHKSIPGKCRESYILEEIWKCLKEHVCNGRIFPEALGRPHLWKKLPLLFLWGASV